jgi:hypothetical protein
LHTTNEDVEIISIPNYMQPKKKKNQNQNHITITKTWETKTSKQNSTTQTNNNNNKAALAKELTFKFEATHCYFSFTGKRNILHKNREISILTIKKKQQG